MNRSLLFVLPAALLLWSPAGQRAAANELPPKYEEAVTKGLEWLSKQQFADGHWEAQAGQPYPMAMTGLAGMAFLMEGSTLRDGKYQLPIRKAVDWFLKRSQTNGLLGNPANNMEMGRYMYGHGYGLMFLACVYGEEDDPERRTKLEDVLTRAVQFTAKSQSSTGGWNYVSGADTGYDAGHEGSVTIVQVQSLRAARNAGIVVPAEVIKKANNYLKEATDPNGGVRYQLGGGPGTGPLTVQAIACLFSAGEYDNPLVKDWLGFVGRSIPLDGGGAAATRFGHYEYTHYYYAQVAYMLGEDGYVKLFPKSREGDRLTWNKYKTQVLDDLLKRQSADGSWTSGYIGTVYSTSCFLAMLQLEKGTLPLYQK
jgi:hypothetical protein